MMVISKQKLGRSVISLIVFLFLGILVNCSLVIKDASADQAYGYNLDDPMPGVQLFEFYISVAFYHDVEYEEVIRMLPGWINDKLAPYGDICIEPRYTYANNAIYDTRDGSPVSPWSTIYTGSSGATRIGAADWSPWGSSGPPLWVDYTEACYPYCDVNQYMLRSSYAPDAVRLRLAGNKYFIGIASGVAQAECRIRVSFVLDPAINPDDFWPGFDPNDEIESPEDPCFISNTDSYAGDPINIRSGNYTHTEADISIPTVAYKLPLDVERTYNSKFASEDGPFGYGWSFNHDMHLDIEYDSGGTMIGNRIHAARGSKIYVPSDGTQYLEVPRLRAGLETNNFSHSLGNLHTLTYGDRREYRFSERNDPSPDGDHVWYRAILQEAKDEHDNRLSYTHTGNNLTRITDTHSGRYLDFEYNGNHITQVYYSANGVSEVLIASYTYSGNGDLVSVTDRNGNTLYYNYDANHKLTSIIDKNSKTKVENVYDAESRVTRQRTFYGAGFPSDLIFTYHHTPLSDGSISTDITDALGNTTTHIFNFLDMPTQIVDANGNVTELRYDYYGNLSYVKDANGNQTFYEYDEGCNCGSNSPSTIKSITRKTYGIEPIHLITIERDPVTGNIVRMARANGDVYTGENVYEFEYTDLNAPYLPSKITDPLGQETTATYNANGQLQTVTKTRNGVPYTYTYGYNDPSGRLTSISGGGGAEQIILSYDDFGRIASITDAKGESIILSYDHVGNLTTVTYPDGGMETGTYDNEGHILTETRKVSDTESVTTTGVYDDGYNLVEWTNPEGETYTFEYDANSNLIRKTDPLLNQTTYAYGALNRLTTITELPLDPLQQVVTFTYDVVGNLIEVTDPLSTKTRYEYDGFYRRIKMIRDYGDATHVNRTAVFEYDNVFNLTKIIMNQGTTLEKEIHAEYDALNRIVKEVIGDKVTSNQWQEYIYNDMDRIAEIRIPKASDPAQTLTNRFTYNSQKRLVQAIQNYVDGVFNDTEPDRDILVQLNYDAVGNLVSVINPLSQTTTYTYDELGRVEDIKSPLSAPDPTEIFGYDLLGRKKSVFNANNTQSLMSYDNASRLTRIDYNDGSYVQYTYDDLGRPVQMQDSGGTTQYFWDELSCLVGTVDSNGNSVEYEYNNGNIAKITYPDGSYLDYAYNSLNQLIEVSDAGGVLATYTYDEAGRVTNISYANGTSRDYTYDTTSNLDLLQEVVNRQGTTTISRFTVDNFDSWGNPLAITEEIGGRTNTYTYTYDDLGRLLTETSTGDRNGTITYSYDALGNRLTMRRTGATHRLPISIPRVSAANDFSSYYVQLPSPAPTIGSSFSQESSYTYDDANRLTQLNITGAGAETIDYTRDDYGNLLSKSGLESVSYEYNSANRMTGITGVAQYSYNGNGWRIGKTVDGKNTDYVLSLGMPTVLYKDSGGEITRYVYGLGRIKEDSVDGEFYYHTDLMGSTKNLTDNTGAQKSIYNYGAFGETLRQEHGVEFRYTGEQYDPESSLVYLRNRYYNPPSGRFTQRDPLVGTVISPQTLNRYSYVTNRPLVYTDPWGLMLPPVDSDLGDWIDWIGGVIGGGIGGGIVRDLEVIGSHSLPDQPISEQTKRVLEHHDILIDLLDRIEELRKWRTAYRVDEIGTGKAKWDFDWQALRKEAYLKRVYDILKAAGPVVTTIEITPIFMIISEEIWDWLNQYQTCGEPVKG